MDVAVKMIVLWKFMCCLAIATDVSQEYVAFIFTSQKPTVIHLLESNSKR
jgi:hypothetical protein